MFKTKGMGLVALILSLSPWGLPGTALGGDGPPLHQISSVECGACHQEIFRQWHESMHARSSPLGDPVHGAMYRMMVGDPTREGVTDPATGGYPGCLSCHAPSAARDGKTKLDALPAYAEGVNCVSCHTMTTFHGVKNPGGDLRVGVNAYRFSGEHLTGGNGAWQGQQAVVPPGSGLSGPVVNPFPHAAQPALFKSSAVCLGCHEQLANPHGVAICTIGDLLTQGEGAKPTCQSCHMPVVNGVVVHTLGGGHDPGMLKRGLILEVIARPGEKGVTAEVTLENTLLHTLPTGAPFRHLILRVTALDGDGREVWQNFRESPTQEDPQAVLMLRLSDHDGKPTLPMMATRLSGDTRLQPGERRTLSYGIPAAGVKTVRVEVFYHRLSRMILDRIGDQLPEEAKQPVLMSRAETTL